MSNPPIQLPAPSNSNLVRQTAVGIAGSPIALSRSTSTGSDRSGDILPPDETMRRRLVVYRTYLEHESDFVENEIQALIQRPPSQDPAEDHALLDLRNSLKVRYNTLRRRLVRVIDLLEALDN